MDFDDDDFSTGRDSPVSTGGTKYCDKPLKWPSLTALLLLSRKIRKNHNEFERRRRDQQRQRLEELRQSIPGLDSKASMVAVLTAAREYIDELKMRVGGTGGGSSGGGIDTAPGHRADSSFFLQDMISPPRSPLGMAAPTASTREFDANVLLGLPAEIRKGSSDSDEPRPIRKGRSDALDVLPPLYGMQQQQSAFFPNQTRPSLMLSVMDESMIFGANRKDSALLLPTPDPGTFVYGQRDSMHALFSVPLPHISEPSHRSYVACGKCARGVENLIMIDCDVCHRWYHIRCMAINPTSIPVRWTCPECPQPAA
jgi:hypothetical protein